ncbi:hypothetical protein METBIDRAFT_96140 [Metschnikowia bicuspidata var. bicuspidata NRRL YB-4993]|uniref:Uncharacterized protein n=1 Tax=Metschnikowia bicuspidata var. bicuspidata NRRL YB-4993 TaxID=869754 RepID=A0A1A0HGL9_9ASCO|nr:hypothetical protein METBIDRAFT_96140 [Metschnikowia bicuspidata var. bicuspidata NRRL YB-4993]OBA22998.1 hypothetical protein METBIDRAFT_96140 [Metschnikowia bicuspidata var. bicuspidata NRRL YB-4993]
MYACILCFFFIVSFDQFFPLMSRFIHSFYLFFVVYLFVRPIYFCNPVFRLIAWIYLQFDSDTLLSFFILLSFFLPLIFQI